MTKTWKLGEVCQGGVITVEIKGNEIAIIGKEWDMSAGSSKGSNQSNAKEFVRKTVKATDATGYYEMKEFLEELSTYYWSEEIMKWIESQIVLNKSIW